MRRMRLFVTFLVALLFFGINAQAQDDEIREALKEMNQECPMDMGEGMTLSSFEFDGFNLIVNIKYDDDANGEIIQAINDNSGMMKEFLLSSMVTEPEMSELVYTMKEVGIGLSVVFKGTNSRKKTVLSFSANEMEKAMKSLQESGNKHGSAERELDAALLMANAFFPMQVSEVYVINGIVLEGEIVMVVMTIDDSEMYESMCLVGDSTLRESVSDTSFKEMLEICKEYKKGIGMRYNKANSTEYCTFSIPYKDLK